MRRSRKIWVPALFTLLTLIGITCALTGTFFGKSPVNVNGQPAPWWDGAFLAAFSYLGLLISLWWFYLPPWEQKRCVIQTEITVGDRLTPVLMFPYTLDIPVFVALVGIWAMPIALLGNYIVLGLTLLPILIITMRAVVGRQFIGLTPDGVVWRIAPLNPERSSDISTRQPVQFLPWAAVSSIGLAEVEVAPASSSKSQKPIPTVMLRVSVSDRSSLAGLASYQRVVEIDQGAEVLLPIARLGPSAHRLRFEEAQTRAEPNMVWETADYYLRHPDEQWQIGDGAVRSENLLPETPRESVNAPTPVVPMTLEPSAADLRQEAQRIAGSHIRYRTGVCRRRAGHPLLRYPICLVRFGTSATSELCVLFLGVLLFSTGCNARLRHA